MSESSRPPRPGGPAAPETVVEELPGERVRVRVAGREFVIDAACPHRKGRLVHGYVNARTLRITCPLHRTVFDLVTGAALAGPTTGALTVHAPCPAAAGGDGEGGTDHDHGGEEGVSV